MNQTNRGVWIGIIVIILIAAFGLWWIAASQPLGSWQGFFWGGTSVTTPTTTSTTSAAPSVTNEGSESVDSIVASLSGASEFQSLFVSTGVSAMTSSGGKYTVFVPLDSAYSNVTKGTISKMTAAQLKRLVEYHVVSGKEIQVGTQTLGVVQALSGDPLNFSDTNNIPMVNSAIVVSEYKGSNGIVYVINDVLIPPQKSTI
ncbi:MAG TPA: fasciclin domain-containing protein [Candidatus Paceibacterota bacterium]|nr:fasciclin domain-containing protein [Candidatus Paceibacterota bacterium]